MDADAPTGKAMDAVDAEDDDEGEDDEDEVLSIDAVC